MNLAEFFYMGGYAFYVWTSYAIAFVVLLANVMQPYLRHRQLRTGLARRLRRQASGAGREETA
jgi:heme exporter protein D